MKLKEKIYQDRRDFRGIYQCENCNFEKEYDGYDDRYFHDEVTPDWKCEKCEKSTLDIGKTPEKVATKYADHEVV